MITRKEITSFVEENNLGWTLDKLWALISAAYPDALRNDYVGIDQRLAMVEHVIHKAFAEPLPSTATESTFSLLCQHLRASEDEIIAATVRTRRDFMAFGGPTAEFTDADVATTLVWVWLADANQHYGNSDTELKYFFYATTVPQKENVELQHKGLENLQRIVEEDPTFIQRAFRNIMAVVANHSKQ